MEARLARLTEKERACLMLVARRLPSKAIAAELGIAKTSVDTYCNRARAKLQVPDRYAAARLLANLGPPPEEPAAPAPAAPRSVPAPRVSRGLAIAIAALVAVLALASLVSGLDALTQMEAPPQRGGAVATGAVR